MSIDPERDAKRLRTLRKAADPYCRVCHGRMLAKAGHSAGCPKASPEDMLREFDRAREHEEWARQRAEYWLREVRQMHGKLAMLKAEVKKLRHRLKEEQTGRDSEQHRFTFLSRLLGLLRLYPKGAPSNPGVKHGKRKEPAR